MRRLSDHHLAGLGFGSGFGHDTVPAALLEEAGDLGFPVFEVPCSTSYCSFTRRANAFSVTAMNGRS